MNQEELTTALLNALRNGGIATGGTNATLIDNNINWQVNQLADATVKLIISGVEYDVVVASNTAHVLTFPALPAGITVIAGTPFFFPSTSGGGGGASTGVLLATGTFTTSDNAVPVDAGRPEPAHYFDGCTLIPLSGAVAFQPKLIYQFAFSTPGEFQIDPDHLFTSPTGLVPYVIISTPMSHLSAPVDSVNGFTVADSVGNKSDTPRIVVGFYTIMAYVKGLINQAAAIVAQTNLILPGNKIPTKTSSSPLTSGTIFNVAGSGQIIITGRVVTQIQAQATTVKISYQADALAAVDWCTTLDINGFAVGSLLTLTGTPADAMVGVSGKADATPGQPRQFTCTLAGIITVTYGAASTGSIKWECLVVPFNSACVVS